MRLPRSFVDLPLQRGDLLPLPEAPARHIQKVLRMNTEQELLLFNGRDGRDYLARLTEVSKRRVTARILKSSIEEPRPELALHLALGISRGERMDFALQKATELGVQSITPLFTRRTLVKLSGERLGRRSRHWRGVIISASEQSGRRWLPILLPAVSVEEWLERKPERTLLLDHRAKLTLPACQAPAATLTFLVGPEGGFSNEERERAYSAGCEGVRLGPRVLRTETAPLAALSAAQVLWGDFR